jgi:hypothetical protein
MQPTLQRTVAASKSNVALWTGRVISTILVLFLVFDGVTKMIKESHVIAASADLGFSVSSIAGIGTTLLACTLLYVISQTAVLGAILLTGYLGGAVAVQVRVGHPVFQCAFPIIFGALVWAGIILRDPRLGDLLPLRKQVQ